jgi:hypothetical protein
MFDAAVLPFMQDGVLAAVTMIAHVDRHVRKVRGDQYFKYHSVTH